MILNPMKCETPNSLDQIRFPIYMSTKIDGWRATMHRRYDGQGQCKPLTSSLKDFRNPYVRMKMGAALPPGLDGELAIVVNGVANFKMSGMFNRKEGMPDFRFYLFDDFLHPGKFAHRYQYLQGIMKNLPGWCELLEQRLITTKEEIEEEFVRVLALGHEGLVLTAPDSPYKHGRSTATEGYRWKMKPWKDTEGVCIGVEEEMHNANEATVSEAGRTKRSGHKANMIPKGRTGKLLVKCPLWPDITVKVAGINDVDKAEFWARPPIGKLIKFKYLNVGGYDKPRMPQFLGIRYPEDMNPC